MLVAHHNGNVCLTNGRLVGYTDMAKWVHVLIHLFSKCLKATVKLNTIYKYWLLEWRRRWSCILWNKSLVEIEVDGFENIKIMFFIHSRSQSGYSLLESAGLAPRMRCTQQHSTVCEWGLFPSRKTCLIKCPVPLLDSHSRKLQPFKCYCSSFQTWSESTCLSGASWDSSSGCDQIFFNHELLRSDQNMTGPM